MSTDVKTLYPSQYYASYDTTATQPTPVTGWYDTWDMSDLSGIPTASDMIAVTSAQWADSTFRKAIGKGVESGAIIDYTGTTTVPVAIQASFEMSWVNQQASMAAAMGETFTADMKSYVAIVKAIVGGTDTNTTTLPSRPTDIMS